MKRVLLATILLALYGSFAFAQWQPQTIGTKADFRGLCVLSPNAIWVSGTKGTFARTSDGGKTWTIGTVPGAESLDFRDIEAFGENTAYLLSAGPGDASRVYKTVDGGKTWAMQFKSADPAAFFDAIAFWDERNGIALGDPVQGQFQLIVTNDGGDRWKPIAANILPPALPGEGAFAASGTCLVTRGENDVWFATGGGKTARVFHSQDRGRNWSATETPIVAGAESAGIFSIAFRDPKRGMIVGGDYRKPNDSGATAAITADGGRTWTALDKRLPFRSAVAWAKDRWIAVGTSGADVSLDDGVTWKRLDRENYNAVQFTSAGIGWAVGPQGRIAKYVPQESTNAPRVGAATVVITPPIGTPMAGYYFARAAEGVHDDLFAKALVLEHDGVKAAMVSLDLISTTAALVKETRREIERLTKIPGAHVMISATHAHTGPVLSTRGLRDSFLGGGSDLAVRYNADLPAKIAQAVKQADDALRPARISAATGHEATIAFNRRFFMKDGAVGWNPGILNPNIVKPAGTIDPEVPVVYFESTDKKPLATYVNYAVHLDNVGGLQFSADLPYTVAKLLRDVKGPDMVTFYTTGTCGDVNHINVQWGEKQRGFENAARMGIILAGEVLRTFPKLKPTAGGVLRSKSALVQLPLPKLDAGDVEKARATVKALETKQGKAPPFLEQVQAFKALDVAAREGKPNEVEVQVIAWGNDIAWVSLPGEIFVELGLDIKKRSPFKHTIIAELANGSIGYVPSRRAYAQGNYEVVSARCAEGSGELLVESALRLLKEMHAP
jgi:neutral ceramidase